VSPRVIVTEYGRPASAALAQAVMNAKNGAALAPVTVIVPSNFAGLAARRMLGGGSLGVSGVANVNFMTPFRLAQLVAVGQLRTKPLTNPVLGAGVRRALAEDPHHFRRVSDHQSTERALAAIAGELSNVSAASLTEIEQSGSNAEAIVSIYRSIRSHLRGFHDEADIARAASHRPDLADVLAPYGQLVWYLPGPTSAPLASFLRSALGVVNGATVIAALTGDRSIDNEVYRSLRIAGLPFAPDPEPPSPEQVREALPVAEHVISVTDADEEVRAVLREVIQLVDGGTPLDRIGIFHPAPDPYVRILEQQLSAAQIPANGPSRRRLSEMIAGRCLLGALELPAERWRRDRVIALVNSCPLRHDGNVARPAAWDELSRFAGVVGGLADWRAKLDVERTRIAFAVEEATASNRQRRVDQLTSQRADVDNLASFIDTLAELVDAVQSPNCKRSKTSSLRWNGLRCSMTSIPIRRWRSSFVR